MRLFIIILSVLFSVSAFSQTLINNAYVRVSEGAVLKVDGNSSGHFINHSDIQNDGVLIVTGDFKNYGNTKLENSSTPEEGVVVFAGNQNQVFAGDSTVFENIQMQGTSLSLEAPLLIEKTAYLYNGIMHSTEVNPVYFTTGSKTTSTGAFEIFDVASNASHIDGPIVKSGSEDFIYPVGDKGIFRPVAITNLSAATNMQVQYFNENANDYGYSLWHNGDNLNHVSSCEFWNVNPQTSVSSNIVLSWDSNSCGVDNPSDLKVAKWYQDAYAWFSKGNSALTGDATKGTITSDSVTTYGTFTLGSGSVNNALPVEFGEITLSKKDDQVLLSWETYSEINSDFYVIEKSSDLENWNEAGVEMAIGFSSSLTKYEFTDYFFRKDLDSYYRLKQVDVDGKFEYSKVLVVTQSASGDSFELKPVDLKSGQPGVIVSSEISFHGNLRVLNASGVLVYSKNVNISEGQNTLSMDRSLPMGLHVVTLEHNGIVKSLKMLN